MPVSVISARELCVSYNSAEVLSDVSCDMEAGDYVGIVGPNGSGKSTFIKSILGLLKPSKGCIRVFGYHPPELKDWHKIGYLPQKMHFFNPHFPSTVREIVALGLISQKKSPERMSGCNETDIGNALELVNISDLGDKLIGDLSGGQQQRVFIARALVNKPELLILDEPATALDPETRETFFALMHDLNKKNNITIIFVTHDMGTIGKYASKMLYLDKKVIFYGSFDEFCHSDNMANVFGKSSQHIICHKHD